eukprot:CAMPEP_0201509668 /NCGR_PEP_ID=MMETSP0161_2-20130828/2654_1 /ASSEMBLY_ACC=CAM_ASM_000251 /TAXON_ID=180227 /ORGANISM="Neoparamoeba aestuarina, Strain SoJaBio B1-5/56/2" /LENGTH=199 /DNA_ID=CAMNT_0047904687 /DNA_START=77 /DNA_END=673 /DNA_ORIENTATION=-
MVIRKKEKKSPSLLNTVVTVEYKEEEEEKSSEGEGGREWKGVDVLEGLLKRENKPDDEKIINLLTSLRNNELIDVVEAVGVIFKFVYNMQNNLIEGTNNHLSLLKALLNTKASQVLFLSCLEASILKIAQQQQQQQLLKQIPKFFKFLYDEDMVVEEAVLKWYSLESKEEKEKEEEEGNEEEKEKEKEEKELNLVRKKA